MTVDGHKFQEVEEVYLWISAKERRGCLAALSSIQVLSHFSLVVMMAKRLGDIRTTCDLDHVKRYLGQTSQLQSCRLMIQLWKQCQLTCLHRRGRCWVLRACWTQTHKSLIWLCCRISAYRPDQAPSDVSAEGSIPAMCPAMLSQQRYPRRDRVAPDRYSD